jgi:hypothetical protein
MADPLVKSTGFISGIVFSPPNVHEAIKVGWGTKLKET